MKIFERMSSYESIDVNKFCIVFPLKSKGMTSRWPLLISGGVYPPQDLSVIFGYCFFCFYLVKSHDFEKKVDFSYVSGQGTTRCTRCHN